MEFMVLWLIVLTPSIIIAKNCRKIIKKDEIIMLQ